MAHNRSAIEEIRLVPRCLVDVSDRQLKSTLFDESIDIPVVVAPTGLNGIVWPNGDIALARAAARANVPFVLSTASNATIEEVADKAGGKLWFQLYIVNRKIADDLVDRALQAGYKTLMLTVDVPVSGKRERDERNGFKVPFRLTPKTMFDVLCHPSWAWQMARYGTPQLRNIASEQATDVNSQGALLSRQMDASFSWDDLKRLRDRWPHRLLVKGVMNVQDASRIVDCGADGVILSNHGGRQLEGPARQLRYCPMLPQQSRNPY